MGKRTKVCILQNGLRHGGTDTFVINLCQAIDKTKFDITIVNPCNDKSKNILEHQIEDSGISIVHTSDLVGLSGCLKHLWRLYRVLRNNRFDTFHTNVDLFNGLQLLVAWLARVPNRICHSHNIAQNRALLKYSFGTKVYHKLMKWLCWHCSTKRIACSREAMMFLYGKNPWQKQKFSYIINNGIDLNRFQKKIDIGLKKKELGLENKQNLLTVGHIFGQKNPEFIISAFYELSRINKEVDLVWVGIGEQLDQMKLLAVKYGISHRIHFLGARSDVPEIMQCCDAFFLPSRFEGLGIVLIEAQAAGLACVASDVVPRLADCGGVNFLSLDSPMSEWLNAINYALEYKPIIRTDKLSEFSIDHMVEQMEMIYN